MLYEKIGRRIRKLRLMRELTQEQLSRKAGISLSFLGHIERSTRKLSVETLYSLSIALNCSADELMDTGMHSAGKLTPKDLLIQAMVLLEDQSAP